jgi:hypothetical protein
MAETEEREQQQQIAMQRAFGIYKGILSDERGVKARKSSLKEALARVDIDWKAFLEALKRAQKDSHTLDLFDEQCMKIEGWARKLIAGEKLVEPGPDDEKEPAIPEDTFDDEEQAEDAPVPAPQPTEDPTEPQPLPAAAESDQFEDDPVAAGPQAEEGEPEWDMGDAPAADPKAAQKTAHVAPAAGAAGVSMDDIPMPQSQIHDLQAEQKKKRQFVDRNERMPAAQYNEMVKAGSSQG